MLEVGGDQGEAKKAATDSGLLLTSCTAAPNQISPVHSHHCLTCHSIYNERAPGLLFRGQNPAWVIKRFCEGMGALGSGGWSCKPAV